MASKRRWATLRYARLIAEVKKDEEISSSIESSTANNIVSGVTQLDIDNAIANLVSSAPDALNTLDELSAALGDDANFATTITTSLNNKANTAMLSNYLQVSNTSSFSTSFANLTDVDISGATDGQTLTYNSNGTITATTIDVGSGGEEVTATTLTKTFIADEEQTITLNNSIPISPVVSATKENPNTTVVTKGKWDVNSTGSNYDILDEAYQVSLTPSSANTDGTFTLSSGSFDASDVSKRIVGNGGSAILTNEDGSYKIVTPFNDTNAISSGNWSMFSLTFDDTDGVKITQYVKGFIDPSNWSYDNVSFFVSGQESTPQGIAFNNDGTKMYIVGSTGDEVNQYTLSTAYDVSTASYDTNFSVSSQDSLARDIVFNNDGTKMYIVGSSGDDINQYTLSTAYNVSTASYDTNFSVSEQETSSQGIAFNNDGTKMYIVGSSGNDINQYTLSTSFDITTASYDTNFSVSSQEASVTGIAFNNDGTKMYIVGSNGDEINQYTLSTAYDVSTASYDTNFSVSSQASSPTGIAFNNDGTKMYIVGFSTDRVYQYTTGIIYASNNEFHPAITNLGGQINTQFWLDINSMTADETKNDAEIYYAVSTDNHTTWSIIDDTQGVRPIVRNDSGTWQYNDAGVYNSNTWVDATINDELRAIRESLEDGNAPVNVGYNNVDGWVYDDVSYEYGLATETPFSFAFNNDGTKIIVLSSDKNLYEYVLPNAYDISSGYYSKVTFNNAGGAGSDQGLTFNDDGTKMYIIGYNGDIVRQYALSTAYDITTAVFEHDLNVGSQESLPYDVTFNSNGTKMYVVGTSSNINQYTLSTAYDISSATFDTVESVQFSSLSSIKFNNDGTKMYLISISGGADIVHQYSLAAGGFEITTAAYDNVSLDVGSQETFPTGMSFNDDGTKMYIIGNGSDAINQYTLSTAYDISSATYDNIKLPTNGLVSQPDSIRFSNDGTKLFTLDGGQDTVFQHNLLTAYDITSANNANVISFNVSQESLPEGIEFNNDGTKMYVIGRGDTVYQYTLSTAFDLSTISYNSVSFSVSSEEANPSGLTFNNDGTKMYITGYSGDDVNQYTLSTAYDISSATFDTNFSVASEQTLPREIKFNDDGTKMYVIGGGPDSISNYTLSTAYDISTASFNSTLNIGSIEGDPRGITFNADGTKAYIVGVREDRVFQFSSTQIFNINKMTKSTLDQVSDSNHFPLTDTLDLAIVMRTDNVNNIPESDGVAIGYSGQIENIGAYPGIDFTYIQNSNTAVTVTALNAGNYKFRIL